MFLVGCSHILRACFFICALYNLGALSISYGIPSILFKVTLRYCSCDVLIRCFLLLVLSAVVTTFLC